MISQKSVKLDCTEKCFPLYTLCLKLWTQSNIYSLTKINVLYEPHKKVAWHISYKCFMFKWKKKWQ